MNTSARCLLSDFGVLRFTGADAGKFLQGQLSSDVGQLAADSILRGGLHNPQGRTVALLWLAKGPEGDIWALLPHELAGTVAGLLKRYLLRAKLSITDESDSYRVVGHWQHDLPDLPHGAWRLDAARGVSLRPLAGQDTTPALAPSETMMTRNAWRALDVAAGAPQVYAVTSGQFVAQMINLDCVDAVSFTKGCYTGQEVIARAHYRGRVKRRMQRFETDEPAQLAAGDTGRLDDGRSFRVVEAVTRADGRSEFLAVAPMAAAAHEAEVEPASGPAQASPLRARALPLPYALPE
jgi:hypothetical protein